MSTIEVDTDNLRKFALMVDDLVKRFTGGGTAAVPVSLHPDPTHASPNIGQRLTTFSDAVDLYFSYEFYRSELVGDPSQLTDPVLDPRASSLAAFVSGLQHLRDTARAIADNYDKTGGEVEFGADQVNAMLNATPTGPGTGG